MKATKANEERDGDTEGLDPKLSGSKASYEDLSAKLAKQGRELADLRASFQEKTRTVEHLESLIERTTSERNEIRSIATRLDRVLKETLSSRSWRTGKLIANSFKKLVPRFLRPTFLSLFRVLNPFRSYTVESQRQARKGTIAGKMRGSPSRCSSATVQPRSHTLLPVSTELRAAMSFDRKDLAPTDITFDSNSMNIHWVVPDFTPGGGEQTS